MKDEELTSLAAKAFGDAPDTFSPLTDDGDALRLAVKLDIGFEPMRCLYEVRAGNGEQDIVTEKVTMGYGFEEATRRAIVRAAAEIGKTL